MYEYDFVPLETTRGTDYTFYDGSLSGTEGHREIIAQRAAQGWRYVGYIPTVQGAAAASGPWSWSLSGKRSSES